MITSRLVDQLNDEEKEERKGELMMALLSLPNYFPSLPDTVKTR
jgi:hypothetical protein